MHDWLKQTWRIYSVYSYMADLQSIALRIDGANYAELLYSFINRLKYHIHQEVKVHALKTLLGASWIALDIDEGISCIQLNGNNYPRTTL